MAIRAHTKLPCIRIIQTNGVAVGHIQRYPLLKYWELNGRKGLDTD
jgi:hypothetical protein